MLDNTLLLKASNGDLDAIATLKHELVYSTNRAHQKIGDYLFENYNRNINNKNPAPSSMERAQLAELLLSINENQLLFKWTFRLKSNSSMLYQLASHTMHHNRNFAGSLLQLLKCPLLPWTTLNRRKDSPFHLAIGCITKYTDIFKDALPFIIENYSLTWNVKNDTNETPLLAYLHAASLGNKDILRTLPTLIQKKRLDWLTCSTRISTFGCCPLYYLFVCAISSSEYQQHLDTVLNNLFDHDLNLLTTIDDMLTNPSCSIHADQIKALVLDNRNRHKTNSNSQRLANIELISLFERLKTAAKQPISKELSKSIKKVDRAAILKYLLDNQEELIKILNFLKPGECYRLPKRFSGLSRTITILRTTSSKAEYNCIIETKCKIASHNQIKPKKNKQLIKSGTFKTGKPVWRIDGPDKPYYHLIVKSTETRKLVAFESEILLSQQLAEHSPYILPYHKGLLRHKKGSDQRSAYSERANGTLLEMRDKIHSFNLLTKYKMLLSLIEGCKAVHKRQYAHEDISYNNVLYLGKNNEHRLYLSDFGASSKFGKINHAGKCTYGFESPEISEWMATMRFSSKKDYHYFHGKKLISWGRARSRKKIDQQDIEEAKRTHPANDMWAIGIIAFQVLHNKTHPTLNDALRIARNPLLNGLLEPVRSKRISIDQALALCRNEITKLQPKTAQIPIIKPPTPQIVNNRTFLPQYDTQPIIRLLPLDTNTVFEYLPKQLDDLLTLNMR